MFRALKFLAAEFGPPKNLIRTVAQAGMCPPPYASVQKWYFRQSVPGDWLPVLVAAREIVTGQPVPMARYIAKGVFS